jgi:hypothetical protein
MCVFTRLQLASCSIVGREELHVMRSCFQICELKVLKHSRRTSS